MAGGFWAPNGRGDQPGTLDGKTVRCIQLAVKNGEFQTYPAIWPCQDQPLSISVPYCLKPKTETDIWQSPPDPGTALWDKAVPRICVHRFSDNTSGGGRGCSKSGRPPPRWGSRATPGPESPSGPGATPPAAGPPAGGTQSRSVYTPDCRWPGRPIRR